jgi:hypothetical protein
LQSAEVVGFLRFEEVSAAYNDALANAWSEMPTLRRDSP